MTQNQCDGCNAKMPIIAGVHYYQGEIHMVCVNCQMGIPQRQADIACRLRKLALEMESIATEMDYYGGLAEWAIHGREMFGAAVICREWAGEIMEDLT